MFKYVSIPMLLGKILFLVTLVKLALVIIVPKQGIETVVVACGVYLIWSMVGRLLLGASMRTGLKQMMYRKHRDAIESLKDSADFFQRNKWIDDLRWIFLLSSAKSGYREMSLVNLTYCHLQLLEHDEAKAYLATAKAEYPESELVKECETMLQRELEKPVADTIIRTIPSPDPTSTAED